MSDEKVKKILAQRTKSSSFLKGIISYYVHRGLKGNLSEKEPLYFISGLEIYSSSMVLLDNLLDKHDIRNNETTYLSEFGPEIYALASQYSTHLGLFKMAPYLKNAINISGKFRCLDQFMLVDSAFSGAIKMDVKKPENSKEVIDSISKVNGYTLAVPLALAATTATTNPLKIWNVFKYGYNSGIAFGIYEEVRDLKGEHGRKRGSELEEGRIPLAILLAAERDKSFNPGEYSGKSLSQKEFESLYFKLQNIRAFQDVELKIGSYFTKSKKSLEKALTKESSERLDLLRKDIEDSLSGLTSIY